MPPPDHRFFLAQDYAVINPMQVGAEGYAGFSVVRLLPRGLERHEHLMPLLIELRMLREGQRLELLERMRHWDRDHDMPLFSALLSSKVDSPRLALHLQRQMLMRQPDLGTAWVRFHDPRVFRHLRWLLTPEQMAVLMGPVTAWSWYEPSVGRWQVYERPQGDGPGFSLTPLQWKRLEQLGALNGRLSRLVDQGERADEEVARRVLMELMGGMEQQREDAWQ